MKKKDDVLPNENKKNTWLEIKKNKSNYLLIAPYMIICVLNDLEFYIFQYVPVARMARLA